ncbi:MAG: LysR family transcriptional regulator [Proteobacteria bacterium]|nr:LysR family transcriptional regulator [Pseudomonadota bacterium]
MDLEALTDFNLVAAQGGFSRAARFSGRPKATLSRRVAELEHSLGVRLIDRGTHTLRLTEEGRALHARTEGLLAEIAEAGEAVVLGASVPRGRLRVSAPIVFAHVALGRIGARFALAYPDVQLEIVADDRPVDPVDDGFDLVIRIDPAPDERLVGRRFLTDERLIVAAPDLPRLCVGGPTPVEVPVGAVVLAAMPSNRLWRMRSAEGEALTLKPQPVLRLSSLLMVRDATVAGAGVALLPKLLVAADVAEGRLALWGVEDAPPVEIWALQSSRRLVGAKVRAFLDVIDQSFPNKVFVPQN